MPFDSSGNASVTRNIAVTGQTVLAEQVNVPFADIQAMLSQVLLRSGVAPMTGPLNSNGFKLINVGDAVNSGDAVNFSQFQTAISSLSVVPVGAVMPLRTKTPPAGWIKEDGGTIGSSASGATNRANDDTLALFTHLWTQFSNTELPIQTNGGSASTRGASAAADFSANKRLPIFDSRTRFIRGSDEGLGYDATLIPGVIQNDEIKTHAHSGNTNDAIPSNPQVRVAASATAVTGTINSAFMTLSDSVGTFFSNVFNGLIHAHSFTTNQTGGSETRPRSTVALFCIKL